jgi:hypothetical protein
MARKCNTCQHIKRAEIDRRLAAGEPSSQIAADYHLTTSSLHRHRANCLKLSSSNAIMKQNARGTAALALLPSKNELGGNYSSLLTRIDQIVAQAEQEGSLKIALSGLNAVRQTLDSMARLSGLDAAQVNVAVQNNVNVSLAGIQAKLIEAFDHEPELKARIAQALLEDDHEQPS